MKNKSKLTLDEKVDYLIENSIATNSKIDKLSFSLNKRIDKLSNHADELDSELNARIDRLTGIVLGIQETTNDLKTEVSAIRTTVDSHTTSLDGLAKQLDTLTTNNVVTKTR